MLTVLDKNIVGAIFLLVLLSIEYSFPFFKFKGKITHIFRNLGIAFFNAIIINLLLLPIILLSVDTSFGLFNQISIVFGLELLFTILIIDLLTYCLHVMYHRIPFFWRFHRMHHSDTMMDVTTGVRFHIGEHVFSVLARSGLYALFAMKLEFIIIYETVFLASVLFHHSNISLSERVDWVFRVFFTSPNMHKVHHSNVRVECDSNYTSLFSFWDRIFGTYTIVDDEKRIVFGTRGFEKDQSIGSMLKTPFRK